MKSLPLVPLLLVLGIPIVCAQPALIVSKPTSYQIGDRIDEDVLVLDGEGHQVRLLDLVEADTEVLVLVLFGGAALSVPEPPFRGPLWCQDSFDDLAIQRAMVEEFRDRQVQIIGIAVPPVYSTSKYGYVEDCFFDFADSSSTFLGCAASFSSKTEALRQSSLIPFDQLFFDPKLSLLQDKGEREPGSSYGQIFPWQGRFKWHLDPRKYGVPTIWILDEQGTVLLEPLWGNEYDGEEMEIRYGFSKLKEAIEQGLSLSTAR